MRCQKECQDVTPDTGVRNNPACSSDTCNHSVIVVLSARCQKTKKHKVTTLLGVTDSYGVSYATLPLERGNGLPPHKLLLQVRKFDACESLSKKITQLVVCVNFD